MPPSFPKNWPTTLSDRLCWNCPNWTATSIVASAPGSRSSSTATVWPSTTAGSFEALAGGVLDGPLEVAVLESQVRLDERDGDGGLGPDRAQRPEADRQVAHAGGVALEDVEDGRRPDPAEHVAVDRRRQERAARDADLVDAAGRREDPEIDLGGALGGARRAAHDGDLVDDHVAAAQRRPVGRRRRPRRRR